MNASAPLVHLGPQVPPAHCAARPVMVAAQCAGPSCGLGGRARNQYKTVHHVSEHPFTLNPVQTGRLGWGVATNSMFAKLVWLKAPSSSRSSITPHPNLPLKGEGTR